MRLRLNPIYEALDDDNPSLAVKICTKALQTSSEDSLIIQALKALGLVRSGQYQQAYNLAYEVKRTKPSDIETLKALMGVFKMLNMKDDIIELYRDAYKVGKDRECGEEWFMSVARKGDWKELQKVALDLKKQFGDVKYYFWMVMTIYLQVSPLEQDKSASMMRSLAEKMMEKQKDEIKDLETLQLYIMILQAEGKYSEAYDLINGPLKVLFKVEEEHIKLNIELLEEVGNREVEIVELCRILLSRNSDDWTAHQALIKYCSDCSEDYKDLNSKQESRARGPYLGEMYWLVKSSQLESLETKIVQYLTLFGSSLSCYEDLYPLLEHVDGVHILKLIDAVDISGSAVDKVRLDVNQCKVKRFVELKAGIMSISKQVIDLRVKYDKSLELLVEDERERQYGDDYLILAVYALLKEYNGLNTSQLYDAIVLLETGLKKSKFNYIFKIILISLYQEIGIATRGLEIAKTLDVKQMQHDTLSYLFTEGLEEISATRSTLRVLHHVLSIYDRNEIETPDMILQAFHFGSYSKIPEFIDFQTRLGTSIQKAITTRQVFRVELLICNSWNSFLDKIMKLDLDPLLISGELDYMKSNFDSLSDNRDVSLLQKYDETDLLSVIRKVNFPSLQVGDWMKRNGLIVILYSQLLNPTAQKLKAITGEDLDTYLESTMVTATETMVLRILKRFLLKSDIEDLLVELATSWKTLESILELHRLDNSQCKEMTGILEAYNAAITYSITIPNPKIKGLILKQLKQIKKGLGKVLTTTDKVKVINFVSILPELDSAIKEVQEGLGWIKSGTIDTLNSFITSTENRISMLKA